MLRFVVESLDGIEESLRPLYQEVEEEGKTFFQLDVEGAVPKEKHHAAIENGRNLYRQLEEAKEQVEQLQTERDQLEQEKNQTVSTSKKKDQEKSTLEERLASLEKAVREKEEELQRQAAEARIAGFRDQIKTTAASVGARKEALDDIALLALNDGWSFDENGNPVRKVNGELVLSKEEVGKPQTYEEYVKELVERKPFLFEASSGDGALGGGTPPAGVKIIPKDDPKAIGENADLILEGKAIVQ